MKDPDRILDHLARLARTAPAPDRDAPPEFTDDLLRRLRSAEPESALALWQLFAVRSLPWAAATVLVTAGLNALVTSAPLPPRDPASELIAQFGQP